MVVLVCGVCGWVCGRWVDVGCSGGRWVWWFRVAIQSVQVQFHCTPIFLLVGTSRGVLHLHTGLLNVRVRCVRCMGVWVWGVGTWTIPSSIFMFKKFTGLTLPSVGVIFSLQVFHEVFAGFLWKVNNAQSGKWRTARTRANQPCEHEKQLHNMKTIWNSCTLGPSFYFCKMLKLCWTYVIFLRIWNFCAKQKTKHFERLCFKFDFFKKKRKIW